MAFTTITNIRGPEGPEGPQGLPGAEGVPTDEAVAILLQVPSESATAASELVRARQEWVVRNVRDFGAVGDGVTDDSVAVQAAVNAAGTYGAVAFEAGKTYVIQNVILLKSGITIEGNGATLRKRTGAAQRALFANKSAPGAVGYGAGGRDITIRNLAVRGDYTVSLTSTVDPVITFHHVSGLTVTNVVFSEGTGHYLDLLGCDGVRIDHCEFRGIRNTVTREFSEAIQVDVSTVEGTTYRDEEPSSFDGLPTCNVKVTHCTFTNSTVDGTVYPMPHAIGSHTGALVTDDGYYQDIWFTDNIMRGWSDIPTVWHGWVHLPGSRGVIIRGNTFVWEGPAVTGSVAAIVAAPMTMVTPFSEVANPTPTKVQIDRPPTNWVIEGNIAHGFGAVTGGSRAVIDFRAAGKRASSVIIGNTVSAAGNGAVGVVDAGDISVKSNTLTNTSTAVAVVLTNTSGSVSENVIRQTGAGHTIRATGCNDMVISNNRIQGGTTGIRIAGMNNGMCCQNYLYDYTSYGIVVGNSDDAGTSYDVSVIGNRIRSVDPGVIEGLRIGPMSTRAMRFGNRLRDGGALNDTGVGTITSSADAIA